MNEILAFLGQTAFSVNGHAFSFGQLIFTPLLLVVGYLLTRWIARTLSARLTSRQVQPDQVHLIRRLFYIVAIAVLVITVLELINVPLTAFAFISGAIAIGVGFGAQNIINNFISGWILMWERPIRIGDFLELEDGAKGTVEAINTRSTRIRRVDGVHMLIPNSKLLENTVVNWTLVNRLTRAVVRVGVAYGSPVRQVSELIYQTACEHEAVLDNPEPLVTFEDFGDSALIFDLYCWIEATADRDLRIIRSDIRFRIDELFNEHGIVIAFPQRDVHIDGTINIARPRQQTSDS